MLGKTFCLKYIIPILLYLIDIIKTDFPFGNIVILKI